MSRFEIITPLVDPTPEQMTARCVPLTMVYIDHDPAIIEAYRGHHTTANAAPALSDLVAFAERHGIPSSARIDYRGCGTHAFDLIWNEDEAS